MINSKKTLAASKKVKTAVKDFTGGYACSQSVLAAFSDRYGLSRDHALRLAAAFEGGTAMQADVCGALVGAYLSGSLGLQIDWEQSEARISSIFKWYGKDFTSVPDFIEKHSGQSLKGLKIRYLDYDWSLNGKGEGGIGKVEERQEYDDGKDDKQ